MPFQRAATWSRRWHPQVAAGGGAAPGPHFLIRHGIESPLHSTMIVAARFDQLPNGTACVGCGRLCTQAAGVRQKSHQKTRRDARHRDSQPLITSSSGWQSLQRVDEPNLRRRTLVRLVMVNDKQRDTPVPALPVDPACALEVAHVDGDDQVVVWVLLYAPHKGICARQVGQIAPAADEHRPQRDGCPIPAAPASAPGSTRWCRHRVADARSERAFILEQSARLPQGVRHRHGHRCV